MERLGMTSKIERKDDKFLLILNEKQKDEVRIPTLLDW
jgi:hypothetical protein